MNFNDLCNELGTKLRTLDDLARFVQTRADGTPNYTLLLGAGCSVTSGVRAATKLTNLWRDELIKSYAPDKLDTTKDEKRNWLKSHQGNWYDPQREYSTLFEKKYDLQRQRRMFVENEVKDATPSIGYAYLTSLVEQDYFNTLFTTNFDDLINEAFFLYSNKRPIVCAHDSSINSITVTSKRPKIIKLHGDYLFDDIKTTDRETESLGQNMKEKYIEFAKDFGLVVVGYAGGDRSIIDVLSMLLKNEDYFRNGIYWCLRKDSEIPEELRRLFWKDRVYFVEIDGFDELFAELYSRFNHGECLPPAAAKPMSRFETSNTNLLENNDRFPDTSPILRAAKDRMKKLSKRKTLANQMVNPEGKDRALSNSNFTDDELLILTKIQRTLFDGNYTEVIENSKSELNKIANSKIKKRLTVLMIDAHLGLRQEDLAIRLIDALIAEEPRSCQWHLRKVTILNNPALELESINKALSIDDQSVNSKIALADWHLRQKQNTYGQARLDHITNAETALRDAIVINPSASSSAWSKLYDLISSNTPVKAKKNEQLNYIESELAKQGRFNWGLIKKRVGRIDIESDTLTKKSLLSDIKEAQNRDDLEEASWYDCLQLNVYRQSGMYLEAKVIIAQIIKSEISKTEIFILQSVVNALRTIIGDDETALNLINDFMKTDEFDSDLFNTQFNLLIDLNRITEAKNCLKKNGWRLNLQGENRMLSKIYEAEKDYTKAIEFYIKSQPSTMQTKSRLMESYLLLCDGNFKDAKSILHEELENCSFTPEASAQIVNYELARKFEGLKPDTGRLEKAIAGDQSRTTKAAVLALKGHKKEAIEAIKEELRYDKSFKYSAKNWPVFSDLRNDDSFKQLVN